MKTLLTSLALVSFVSAAQAQMADAKTGEPAYKITERGPNHRVVSRVSAVTNRLGRIHYRTNSYVELASSMHYMDNGVWCETRPEISPAVSGASALQGPLKIHFPADSTAPTEVITKDGKHLRTRVLGLAYFDASSGKSALIAETSATLGEITPQRDRVVYRGTFTDLDADLIFTLRKSGLEQDILLRQQPPSPAGFGLNPETTRLQVWTEFLDSPDPTISAAR